MTVSVIIPTYNGAQKVLNILRALELQTVQPNEIIVVIDGSTDNTADVLHPLAAKSKLLRVVTQENKGRAAVRNRGAQEATGQLLIFFDDDMRPQPECIQAHVRHHSQNAGTIGVGIQMEEIRPHNTDFQNYKASLSRKWLDKYVAIPDHTPMKTEYLFVTAANLSLPATVFSRINGFDSGLRDIEDFDLGMRASEAGIPIYFIRNAEAFHDDPVTCATYVRRLREYRKAHKTLAEIRPKFYSKYVTRPAAAPAGVKGTFFHLFASPTWLRIVDSGSLTILPRSIRYKLFDIITTAQGSYYLNEQKH
jgi:glycosyltransferase involved in cell wall biosynthesis